MPVRPAHLVILPLALALLPSLAGASESAAAETPPAAEAPAPIEPSRAQRLRDYLDQARAQRRAQLDQLRAESRDDSERTRQQLRDSAEEQSRLHREQLERWREPPYPTAAPPPGDWSNPWYYRGW
jgi:hypothetical protein